MGQKAVFLDRDGTINIEKKYLYKIEDFEYLKGVQEGLRLLQEEGYLLIIITNQSGIARGYYTEKNFFKLDQWMREDLKQAGITISETYYCPHHPDAEIAFYRKECNCRKPRLGLFYQAINRFDIELERSYAIGDKPRDLEICRNTDVKGFLLYCADEEEQVGTNIECIRGGVLEAARRICNKTEVYESDFKERVDKRSH